MIEKVGNKDVVVRNYTSNFSIKEYIQEVLIPKAFPNIPVNKLNLGLTGITSEMISQAIEDSAGTAALMMNEAFITRAILPNSIYSEASLFNLGYTFATPSKCSFALEMWLPDVIKYSSKVRNTNTYRYYLDKDTKLILGDNSYRLDYDIIIDHQMIDGKRVFNVYYDMSETNSVSQITNKYIKHQITSINWLILFIDLREFSRKVEENSISDNLVTVNSDVKLRWTGQIAGLDLVYITPTGERLPMKLKTQYTRPEVDPFTWYRFYDDNTILLSFSNNKGYFAPAFNSKIESTIYTCKGASANFDSYDRKAGVPVQKVGDRFPYNSTTQMVALCYGGSTGGLDRGNIELLRDDVILAHNTANVLTTDHDLQMWFNRYAKLYGTRAEFYKRRDDPSGTLFSQFVAIMDNTYVYPTNTLSIEVSQEQFDFINNDSNGINKEFIIKPGHLWEYADKDGEICRDKVRMVTGVDGMAMITDETLPSITSDRPFMFVNPFYIKIHRDPMISANYNYLIDHTSWPEDIEMESDSFYQFQLATFSVERSISKKFNNKYRLQVICVPVITTNSTMKYVEGVGDDFDITKNNLRLVLITRTQLDGETGYIEMKPVEMRPGDAILFEAEIAVHDNLQSDMTLQIDLPNTPGMHSLITTGPRAGNVFLDSAETSFHFACMMKDFDGKSTTNLFGDESFKGYVMTNRFANAHRDLTLYKPMNMMRSVINFEGQNDNYTITASLIPFLKYDIPLDDDKMSYFIRAFSEQYAAMEPVLSKMNGNSYIDFKLFNTYGRSSNYYIGPKDGSDVLWDSDILLDNVYVGIKFRMAVYDRSLYTQTVESVVNDIKSFFDSLNTGERVDVHVSDLIHIIKEKEPNVRYIRFIGFNNYDANKQSIFVKYSDISELREDQLHPHVPEMIRVDNNSIEVIEEV
ncbi:MAG: hypothetical protein NC489_24570 [Ruminococcus flavefaciens]|nr:hypothetical protein [Ruminococcus flavefaciens]